MPMIRFTKLTWKVRMHLKKQTARKRRKNPIKEGDILHVWVLEKLGEAVVTKVTTKKLKDMTLEDAKKDGFDYLDVFITTLQKMHQCDLDEEFDLIEYEPRWPKQKVVYKKRSEK